MSYNYEINHNDIKKKLDQSKYICKTNEDDAQTYIFELVLKNNTNQPIIIRKIKKSEQGTLLTSEDTIHYNMIEKYKLTVININDPEKIIVVKSNFDNSISTNTFMNNMIYIEMTCDSNKNLIFNYMILN